MNNFDFHYQNFRTIYTAAPAPYSIRVYAGKEYVTQFSVTEMQEMMREGKIVIVNKEENYESA